MNNTSKEKKIPKRERDHGSVVGALILVGLIWAIFTIGGNFFDWAGDKMDSRDSRKERCINETYNIKNEFTAKKMYKACMKR